MRTFDVVALVVAVMVFIGFVLFFMRDGGGGDGGNSDFAVPTSRLPMGGGYIPGYTGSGLRNGGVGSISPEVWAN